MAFFSKEAYEGKLRWRDEHNAKQEKNKSLTPEQHEAIQDLHRNRHDFHTNFDGRADNSYCFSVLMDDLRYCRGFNLPFGFLLRKAIKLCQSFMDGDEGFVIWDRCDVIDLEYVSDTEDEAEMDAFYEKRKKEMMRGTSLHINELNDTIRGWIEKINIEFGTNY